MSPIHSTRWHRVASLKPRLARQLTLRRQQLRGETWFVLANPVSGRSVRLNHTAYGIAARMDGQHNVQQLWDRSLQRDAEAVTQDEVIDLLAQLRESGLVQFDRAADFDTLLPHLDTIAHPRGRASLLAWRIALGNPTRLLNHLAPLQKMLFSRTAALMWLLAIASLLALAMQHGPTLWAHALQWMATPRFALLAAVLYLPIKLVHELSHGLAVRRWGGQVREAGVTLMLLLPVPYLDASAASSFGERRARIAVSAAGIMSELAIAALALPLWLWLDDGPVRDGAFVVLAITGVSTVLFNGNPLQRLDGYYIFCDVMQLPNLGPRSRAWWLDRLRRLLDATDTEPMAVALGETPWLAAYAPLSWLMALFISTMAIVWLGGISFALGLLAGLVLGWQMLLRPIARLLGQLRRATQGRSASTRRWRRTLLAGTFAGLLILTVPWPRSTLVQGVIWPPDQAQLRIEESGFVEQVAAADGQMVRIGDLVLQLASPQLRSDHASQSARVASLEAELVGSFRAGRTGQADAGTGDARAELTVAQAQLQRLQTRIQQLAVRAQVDGRLVLPNAADLPGQFLRRGQLMGQTLDGSPPVIRVALPEHRAGDLRGARETISVRLSGSPRTHHPARLLRDSTGAVLELPSAALSTRHGGDIVTDPADDRDRRPVGPVVLLDVQLRAPQAGSVESAGMRIGERAWVRFGDGAQPLALQWARALRSQMLRRFNPQL